MSQTTTSEVIETLNESLEQVEAETSELAGGVRVVVPDEEIGRVMGLLNRELDTDYEAKRDPSGDNLVVNIEARRPGLGDLFR